MQPSGKLNMMVLLFWHTVVSLPALATGGAITSIEADEDPLPHSLVTVSCMAKLPVSVTLGQDNLLWLRGRTAGKKRRSVSEVLDEVITAARQSGLAPGDIRSVVGTIDIAADDPFLEKADAYVRAAFDASLGRPADAGGRTRAAAPPASSRAAGRKRRRRG